MLRVSERTFRVVCALALASLCIIILTGALVRLTGSGLGCVDWPRCNESKFIDVSTTHGRIEQLNRLFTGVVSASVIAAVLLAHRRAPKRSDLVALAWGLVAGVLAQVVIGGIVVLTGLNPFANMAHFLVSMVLVAVGLTLMRRAGMDREDAWFRPLPSDLRVPVRLFAVSVGVAIVTGTVVTATGPHAGDENAIRFGFELASVARVHGASVITAVALLVWSMVRARRIRPADKSLMDALQTAAVVAVFQALIGYVQYFSGVPVVLVAVHIVGATAMWLATCSLVLSPETRRGTSVEHMASVSA